jgi:4-aminobutyrate aminotransferase-like enzyme
MIMVMRPFQDKGLLPQIWGNNHMALKVAPSLVVTKEKIEEFVPAIGKI